MSASARLDRLLPRYVRLEDLRRPDATGTSRQAGPLAALLDIIGEQAAEIRRNIAGLSDDLFIETCAEWVVPYIGDLVGAGPLRGDPGRRRADVARTIYYRRRKGTLPMLEELARDVTGWHAHAVAFHDLLNTTQHLDNLRMEETPETPRRDPRALRRVGAANLRDMEALDLLDSPFDRLCHSVDLRPPSTHEGWHGLRNLGFFLWRIRPQRVMGVQARPLDPPRDHRFRFSPAGVDTPIVNNPDREADTTRLATERHVPGPIRPRAFVHDKGSYYGHFEDGDFAFAVYRGGEASRETLVKPEDIVCMDLSTWAPPPRPGTVGVDLRRGRLTVRPGEVPKGGLTVSYHYGFSAYLGGGGYERRETLTEPAAGVGTAWVSEIGRASGSEEPPAKTLLAALRKWSKDGKPSGLFRIRDSRVYGGHFVEEQYQEGSRPTGRPRDMRDLLTLQPDTTVAIEADNNEFPSVRVVGNLAVRAPPEGARLVLNGLLIEGGLTISGPLELDMRHCTIVPGRMHDPTGQPLNPDRDAIVVDASAAGAELRMDRCVLGPLRVPEVARRLYLQDSIVQSLPVAGRERPAIAATDKGAPGPALGLQRTTVFGSVSVGEVDEVNDSIVTGPLLSEQRQTGCIRFSYLGPGSRTPRRFHCQPDQAAMDEILHGPRSANKILLLDAIQKRSQDVRPVFASTHYGSPYYARLHRTTPDEIRRGAENGSEMGVFCSLEEPLREDDLRERLEEYMPFGLTPGLIDANQGGDQP